MFDSVNDVLDRVSSPGDMATVLLAGTAGFLVDAALNLVGFLSPGAAGIAAASAALGLKKALEAGRGRHAETKRVAFGKAEAIRRGEALREVLRGSDRFDLQRRLFRATTLYEAGALSDVRLQDEYNFVVSEIMDVDIEEQHQRVDIKERLGHQFQPLDPLEPLEDAPPA
ncbi:hypothetical protein AB0F59_30535 [Micromonospora lupini]|uniref:hypothetical protein n=1 Tax=Micromonospora lupini TaxID=285679 RepID=UPI0033CFF54F